MQDTLIEVLRRATAAQHSGIEATLRLDPPFDLDHYGRVLQIFELFLRSWEPRIEKALPPSMRDWFRSRSRAPFVRADLKSLALPLLDGGAAVPAIDSTSAALGSMYVMEGSALGGQVIARQVKTQYGLTPEGGAAYFSGWGPRTGAMWKEFQQVLAREDAAGADRKAAARAAAGTFDALTAMFERTARAH